MEVERDGETERHMVGAPRRETEAERVQEKREREQVGVADGLYLAQGMT